jgi:hypothetical protein
MENLIIGIGGGVIGFLFQQYAPWPPFPVSKKSWLSIVLMLMTLILWMLLVSKIFEEI